MVAASSGFLVAVQSFGETVFSVLGGHLHFVSCLPHSDTEHSVQNTQPGLMGECSPADEPSLGPRRILVIKADLLLCPQVPPLQEQDSSCNRARELQGQESILGQGTDEQRPLTGGLRQRRNTHRTEQVLEWLFISQEQSKPTQSQVNCLLICSYFCSSYFFLSLSLSLSGGERDGDT